METKSRNRGVKASRAKLDLAMLNAGLKTQSALAEKIAENENLENAPKETVNRVFRQEKVSPTTVARIARVLGVEAYSLYLSSNDHSIEDEDKNGSSIDESAETSSQSLITVKFAIVLFIFVTGLAYLYYKTPHDPERTNASFAQYKGKETRLAIVSNEQPHLVDLRKKLQQELSPMFNVTTSSILKYNPKISPWELPNELSVDYIINLSSIKKGAMTGIFTDIFTRDRMSPIFADAWDTRHLSNQIDLITSESANKIAEIFGVADTEILIIKKNAVLKYMEGMNLRIEGDMTLNRVNQQLSSFQQALTISPHYHKARISVCMALSDSYHITRNIDEFKRAIARCEKLNIPGKDASKYHMAIGNMYRRIGKLEKSITQLRKSIELNSNSSGAYSNLSSAQFKLGAKKHNKELISDSLNSIKKSIELAPFNWKPLNALAMIQYSTGDASGALESQEQAVILNANATSLNNLAGFNFCDGEMSRAEELYEQVLTLRHPPLVAKYNLASVYSFYSKNELAAKLIEDYMMDVEKENGEIPIDALVGLADIYRHQQLFKLSRKFYELAYQRVETKRLNGTINSLNETYLTYIEIALGTLNNQSISKEELLDFEKRLILRETNRANPNVKIVLIFSWDLLENSKKAVSNFELLLPQCRALAETPLFEKFRMKL